MGYYQVLAWWDVWAAMISLVWFTGLCYVFCIAIVRPLLITKGTAKNPFLLWGEKEKANEPLLEGSNLDNLYLSRSRASCTPSRRK